MFTEKASQSTWSIMSKESIAIWLACLTFIVTLSSFAVAYSQMKIASAKAKLDLYNKRFGIYQIALDYYQSAWWGTPDEMKEKSLKFTTAFRESQFLFDEKDGVHNTLKKIQQNGYSIFFEKEYKYKMENNLTLDKLDLDQLRESSNKARDEFEINIIQLESQLKKYLEFKNIHGWSFRKFW